MFRILGSVAITLLMAIPSVAPAAAQTCRATCEWGYGPQNGPETWAENCCPVCAGRSQSPIDIRTADLAASKTGALELHYLESHFEFSNDDRTLGASYELEDNENYVEVAGERYALRGFHFHSLSEHTIDGRHSPLEVHFVHRRTSYDLAVVAVMIEEGDHKPAYNALWNSLPADSAAGARTVILNPRKLVPNSLEYYTYRGSLTIPSCDEVVSWYVLKNPMQLSTEQIEAFRALFSHNYRPTQALNGRVVSESE